MRVLIITGDKKFGPGHPRFALQASAVEKLAVRYWGRGSLWLHIPNEPFDVVTAQDPFWRGLVGWYVARRLKTKFNVQVHADLSGQSFIKHILVQIVLRHADSVRVVSEKIKQQVEHIGVRAPITVLPVYVDVSTFTRVARRPQVGENILWMGRFEEEKNPLEAIEVFQKVLEAVPDARLMLLGRGSLESALRREISRLNLEKWVELPGWQNPLLFLDTADVVLCTSWHESWGASIVEALAAGVPVVAPDVGVAREAGAFVVDDRAQLAQKVIEVLRSGTRGELKLTLLDARAWAEQWRNSLI